MKIINEKILSENIESRMLSDLDQHKIGGACVKVCQCGHTVFQAAFGVKNAETNEPLSTDALFRMASMTKPITATAVLIQANRGLLSVTDPIEKYFPGFADRRIEVLENGKPISSGAAKEKVRIFHLLTHTSGIGSCEIGDHYTSKMTNDDKKDLSSVISYYEKMPIAFEPMSTQFYSPVAAFDILAGIVEKTSEMSYDKFLKQELFDVLGMKDTAFVPTDEQWARMITMHDRSNGKSINGQMSDVCIFADFPTTYFCGGAGLASTVDDYSLFAEMLCKNDGSLIRKELLNDMIRPQLPSYVMPGSQVWGYGVRVITDCLYGYLPPRAFGWSGAYGTHFWVDPENKITAVYMKNSLYDGGAGAVTAFGFEDCVTRSLL